MKLIAHFHAPFDSAGESQVFTSKKANAILVVWNLSDTTGDHHKVWKLGEDNLIEALVFARDVVRGKSGEAAA